MSGYPKKATDQQIIEAYQELGSIWKVAKRFSMCGQSVHERLKRLNVSLNNPKISEEEKQIIKEFYEKGFDYGSEELKALSLQLKRPITTICKVASQMNLTKKIRNHSLKAREKTGIRIKKWHQENPHPKGMLGKTHSEEYSKECGIRLKKNWDNLTEDQKCERTLKRMKARLKSQGTLAVKKGGADVSWKQGWRNIGGKEKYYRSRWEANYARFLEFLKKNGEIKEWEHEPHTFWFEEIKRGCRSYLPDFKITKKDGSHYWAEVKGYYDERSLTKIKRFRKYYPKEHLELIDKVWFKSNSKKLQGLIEGWEISRFS